MNYVNRTKSINIDKIRESELIPYSTKLVNSTIVYDTNKYNFKVIMIGDLAVGKTSILNRFVNNEFNIFYQCTVGVEYKTKNIKLDNINECNLKIWDTCGEERFRSITKLYFKDTQGAVLVFDLTSKSSFDKLNVWLDILNESAPKDISIILVGNKMDIKERKVYLSDDAKKFALKNKMTYIEVSAKEGTNVIYLFETICKKMINKLNVKNNLNQINKKKEKNKTEKLYNSNYNGKKKQIELDKKIFEERGKTENQKSKCC
jgi:small GTP-binding protein